MIIHRHVPLFAPMAAANEATDPDAPHGSDAFHKWFLDMQVSHGVTAYGGGRSLLHTLSLPVEVLLAEVLPNVPDTPVGRAWAECVRECIRLTEADVVRPYDYIEYDTPEEMAAWDAIETYAGVVEQASPLLQDVADTIERMPIAISPGNHVELDALTRERSRLSDEGLMLGNFVEEFDKEHGSYGHFLSNARLIPWAHIEALLPDFEATLRSMLGNLDAHLPEVAAYEVEARGRDLASVRASIAAHTS